MKILFIGAFSEPSQEFMLYQCTKGHISVSASTFQKAFLSGFAKTNAIFDYIINAPAIGSFPLRCSKLNFHSSKFVYNNINGINVSFKNLTYFKNRSICHSIRSEILKWIQSYSDEQVVIVVYSLMYPYIKAAIDAKRKYSNVHICCIVLDLPQYFVDNKSFLSRFLSKRETKNIYSLVPEIDSFVLLTQDMATALDVNQRPWLLMEGIYQPRAIEEVEKKAKTVLYTGNLDGRFGIRDLVEAFSLIADSDFALWICGDGADRVFVEEAASKDSRIRYWGLLPQEQIFMMQKEATLLINPRKAKGEFTKYSFPSKTMEYMASATPTLMYDLPGVPSEYKEFLVIIPDDTLSTLAQTIYAWGIKEQSELDLFGKQAQEFILHKKNSYYQAGRFANFIKDISYEKE